MVRRIAIASVLWAIILVAASPQRLSESHLRPAQFVGAQGPSNDEPAAGRLLVSSTKLQDPNFRHTVVLLIGHDPDKGTLGLIINRRSKVPLSRVFPEIKANGDPAFLGGPVEGSSAQALLRATTPSGHADHVLGDVYSTADKSLIEKSISSAAPSSRFRVYLGYAGWASDQLESEIEVGAWSVLRTSPDEIFDDDPDSLWARLSRKADSQIAKASAHSYQSAELLPDATRFVRLGEHRVALFATKGVAEFRHVADSTVHAELARRVRVSL